MADIMSSERRSELMSRVRDRDTKPEVELRRALWARGHRYRLRYPLNGRPDLVFPRARLAVFVDGCFWHGCPIHGSVPSSNSGFWSKKLGRNKARDREVTDHLESEGWTVARFWEHQIEHDLGSVVETVEDFLRN